MITPDLCIYHGSCVDGFTAAWVVWERFADAVDAIEFHAGYYGAEPPDVTGRRVLIVDFSYKRPVMERMAAVAAELVVLDHHKTAAEDLLPLLQAGIIGGEFDMERSGAGMAWDYCFGRSAVTPPPPLVQHVQDRDLWRFTLDGTREIHACLASHPYDFQAYRDISNRCFDSRQRRQIIAEGAAIDRKHLKDVTELTKAAARPMVIGGHRVMVANLPPTMASDGAGLMADGAPFAATYFDIPGKRLFSLRSKPEGADVSAIAKAYGGGGHRNAAGFSMPLGWEGDAP